MTENKFAQLCLKTFWENGDTCNGCPLNDKDVCERLTRKQACKTKHANTLKKFVKQREKEKRRAEKQDSITKFFNSLNKTQPKAQRYL